MKTSFRMRGERELRTEIAIGKMRLIRECVIRGDVKLGEGRGGKERLSWTTPGHSSVKSTSRGCHGNGTGSGTCRTGGVASTWRDEWVLGESAYTPRSLHPPSSAIPFLLFACSPTLQPLSAMAPSVWMLHRIADAWSVTRL